VVRAGTVRANDLEARYAPSAVPADSAYHLGALIADASALHDALGGTDWYLFMFRDPACFAEALVAADGMSFVDRLWREWSPGFDAGEHLALVKESLADPANLAAAIGYYRANGPAAQATVQYAREQAAVGQRPPQRTLYLHGANDGCVRADLARAAYATLAPGSRVVVIEEAGHFLHLERPGRVGELILGWLTS